MEAYMPFLIWGGLLVLTVVAEIISQQLISIWFAAGALAAFVAACFGASPVVQCVLFVAVSVLLLVCTRPIVKKVFTFGIKDTNTQEIGRIAVVIQPIDPIKGTGRVRLDGVDWIAVSQNGAVIPEQTSVRIEAVEGTKLFVSQLPESAAVVTNHT
ncbi:NfeD family protein [Ruminococcus sp.]|uniref:NfeD family protein n=1 Tax=Ruminococcus sp. TaxID=41978 RepID=UPI0025E1F164|nr:NfeD family protein [Ruminococcus sp.]